MDAFDGQAFEGVGRRNAGGDGREEGMAAEEAGVFAIRGVFILGLVGGGEKGGFAEGDEPIVVVVGVAGFAVGPGDVIAGEEPSHGGRPVVAPLVKIDGVWHGIGNAVVGSGGGDGAAGLVEVVGKSAAVALFHHKKDGAGDGGGKGLEVAVEEPFLVPEGQGHVPFAAAGGGAAVVGEEDEELVLRGQAALQVEEGVADAGGGGVAGDVAFAVAIEIEGGGSPIAVGRGVVEIHVVDGGIGAVGDEDEDVGFGVAVFLDEGGIEEGGVAPVSVGIDVGGVAAGDQEGKTVGVGLAVRNGIGGARAFDGKGETGSGRRE